MCTGNICRSPIAERLSVKYLADRGSVGIEALSAGTRAVIGHPIHESAAQVVRQFGSDPSGFTARQLNTRIARQADLILTMTRAHRDKALELAPMMMSRTFTLAEAGGIVQNAEIRSVADFSNQRPFLTGEATSDIDDPIGQAPPVFSEVGRRIAELLWPVLEVCVRSV
ncbi:low molecular weight phosphatase family protein [Mycolicibacterium sp. 3033]|nr:low molecular weight phosphatase family protein [Mycolicibacterium aurantiacum]